MLAMVALNELFLGIEVYLAHGANGTIVPSEWYPIYYGLSSSILLVLAGLLATRHRTAASVLATVTLVGSAMIGFLGVYFHLARAVLPTAPAGERLTLNLLVWAPPVLGPLAYCLAGLLGISAAWEESPSTSGRLVIYKAARHPSSLQQDPGLYLHGRHGHTRRPCQQCPRPRPHRL